MKFPLRCIALALYLPLTCNAASDDDFQPPEEKDTFFTKERYPSASPSKAPSLSPSYEPTVDPCMVDLQGNNRKVDGDNFVLVEYSYELNLNKTDASTSNQESFIKEMEFNITKFILEKLYPVCEERGVRVDTRRNLRSQNSVARTLSEHRGMVEGISTLPDDKLISGYECQYPTSDAVCNPVSGSLKVYFKESVDEITKEAGRDAVKNIVGTLLCNENAFETSDGLEANVVCSEKGPGIRLIPSFNRGLFIGGIAIGLAFVLILASLCYVRKQRNLWGDQMKEEENLLRSSPEPPCDISYSDSIDADIDPEQGAEGEYVSLKSSSNETCTSESKLKGDEGKINRGGFFGFIKRKKIHHDDDHDFQKKVLEEIPAEIRLFSGCSDTQKAADIPDVSDFKLPSTNGEGGACTAAFLKTLYEKQATPSDASYVDVLHTMRHHLEKQAFTQIPQLSSTRAIKVTNKFQIVNPLEEEMGGIRRAVLIGIRYTGQDGELDGCHNDVDSIKEYLINVQGFKNHNIAILMDDGLNTYPTKDNIMAAYRNLVQWSKAGDSIFCHFSGHGVSTLDRSGDEPDGQDENLVPVDYTTAGFIVDDELYTKFVKKMPKDVLVTCLFDCCHSGTALDLPYEFTSSCDKTRGMTRKDSFKFRAIPEEHDEEFEKKSQRFGAISNNIGVEDDMVPIPEEESDIESSGSHSNDELSFLHGNLASGDDQKSAEKSFVDIYGVESSNTEAFGEPLDPASIDTPDNESNPDLEEDTFRENRLVNEENEFTIESNNTEAFGEPLDDDPASIDTPDNESNPDQEEDTFRENRVVNEENEFTIESSNTKTFGEPLDDDPASIDTPDNESNPDLEEDTFRENRVVNEENEFTIESSNTETFGEPLDDDPASIDTPDNESNPDQEKDRVFNQGIVVNEPNEDTPTSIDSPDNSSANINLDERPYASQTIPAIVETKHASSKSNDGGVVEVEAEGDTPSSMDDTDNSTDSKKIVLQQRSLEAPDNVDLNVKEALRETNIPDIIETDDSESENEDKGEISQAFSVESDWSEEGEKASKLEALEEESEESSKILQTDISKTSETIEVKVGDSILDSTTKVEIDVESENLSEEKASIVNDDLDDKFQSRTLTPPIVEVSGASSTDEGNVESDTVVSGLTSMGEMRTSVKGSEKTVEVGITQNETTSALASSVLIEAEPNETNDEVPVFSEEEVTVKDGTTLSSGEVVIIEDDDVSASTEAIVKDVDTVASGEEIVVAEDIDDSAFAASVIISKEKEIPALEEDEVKMDEVLSVEPDEGKSVSGQEGDVWLAKASESLPANIPEVQVTEDLYTDPPIEDPPLVDEVEEELPVSYPKETTNLGVDEDTDVSSNRDLGGGTSTPEVISSEFDAVIDETHDTDNILSYLQHSGNVAAKAEQSARDMESAVKEILSHASSEDRLDDQLSGGSSEKKLSIVQYGDEASDLKAKELLSQMSAPSPEVKPPTSVASDGEVSPVDSSLGGLLSDDAIAIEDSHQLPPLAPRAHDLVIPGTIDFVPKKKESTISVGEGEMIELSERYLKKMKEYQLKKAKRKAKYRTSPTLEEEKEFVDDETTRSSKELLRLEAELEFLRLTEEMNRENEEEHRRLLELEEQRKSSREKERDLSSRLAEAEYKIVIAKEEERRLAIEEKKRIAKEKKKRVISFLAEVKERTRLVEEAAFDLFNDDGSLASSATSGSLAMIREKIRNRKRPSED